MNEMGNPHKLEVGQTLFHVTTINRNRHGGANDYPIVITKIGRKWATYEQCRRGYRIDLETLKVDGGGYSSPAQCHLSEEAYTVSRNLSVAWDKFRLAVSNSYHPPTLDDPLTIADVKTMADRLNITLPEL